MNLELTIEETNLILSALGELPAKQSMNLIIKIMKDYEQQTTVKEEKPTE
jgi:lipase chaperone LimK